MCLLYSLYYGAPCSVHYHRSYHSSYIQVYRTKMRLHESGLHKENNNEKKKTKQLFDDGIFDLRLRSDRCVINFFVERRKKKCSVLSIVLGTSQTSNRQTINHTQTYRTLIPHIYGWHAASIPSTSTEHTTTTNEENLNYGLTSIQQ